MTVTLGLPLSRRVSLMYSLALSLSLLLFSLNPNPKNRTRGKVVRHTAQSVFDTMLEGVPFRVSTGRLYFSSLVVRRSSHAKNKNHDELGLRVAKPRSESTPPSVESRPKTRA